MMSGGNQPQSSGSHWDISLYEVHRKPHEVVTDETLIGVSPRALHSELMCPICLDLMRNTQTTKECLHRFCQECIITALRSGNKECPTCRKKLVSKRSLRSDPNFDSLIAKIYPNREELQQQEKQRTYRPSLHPIQKRKRREETPLGTESPALSPNSATPPVEKKIKLNTTADDESNDSDREESSTREEEPRIEFQLRPHPSDSSVSTNHIRNLSSTPDATVAHLVKFLQIIQNENGGSGKYTLSTVIDDEEKDNKYMTLTQTTSLKQICDTYWIPGEKLKLFFSSGVTQPQ